MPVSDSYLRFRRDKTPAPILGFWSQPPVIAALSGAVAGVIHVLSGPDHLAAVAPLTIRHPERAWATGLKWGLGHAAGVAVVGVLALLLREILPIAFLSSIAERLVGVVLIGIGLWGIRTGLTSRVHAHEHVHGGSRHLHFHVHDERSAHRRGQRAAHDHTHAALAVGTLHGLAGSSHFFGILPALAFPTGAQAAAYLAAYAIATLVAMAGFSSALAAVTRRFAAPGQTAYRVLMVTSSVLAVVVGGVWLRG
jgi:hypothetical protein